MAFKELQKTKMAFKELQKTDNLRTLQLEVEIHFVAIFLHPCVVIGMPNMHVKGHIN